MYVCMYIYIYIHVYTYVCVCIYIYVYIYIYIYNIILYYIILYYIILYYIMFYYIILYIYIYIYIYMYKHPGGKAQPPYPHAISGRWRLVRPIIGHCMLLLAALVTRTLWLISCVTRTPANFSDIVGHAAHRTPTRQAGHNAQASGPRPATMFTLGEKCVRCCGSHTQRQLHYFRHG